MAPLPRVVYLHTDINDDASPVPDLNALNYSDPDLFKNNPNDFTFEPTTKHKDDIFLFKEEVFAKTSNNKTSSTKGGSDIESVDPLEPIMPYQNLSKNKKALHTPFTWNYEKNLMQCITKGSLYSLKEVLPPGNSALSMSTKSLYQIQPNEEKLKDMRDKIKEIFKIYYKAVFYSKIKIDFHSEFSFINSDLEDISSMIENGRIGDYGQDFASALLFDSVDNELVKAHKALLEPIMNRHFIPTMKKLKEEQYNSGYVDDRFIYLNQKVNELLQDINNTIILVAETRKRFENAESFSGIPQSQINRFAEIKNPQRIYEQFVKILTWIKMFKNEVRTLSKMKELLSKNLKAAIVVQVFESYGEKLYDLNNRLVACYNQLNKKIKSKTKSNTTPRRQRPLRPISVNVKHIIDDGCLEAKHVNSIYEMMTKLEIVVVNNERAVKDLGRKKESELLEMFQEVSAHLDAFEHTVQGFTYAQEIQMDMEKAIKDLLKEKHQDVNEEQINQEHHKIRSQIRTYRHARDFSLCTPSVITSALNKAYEKHMVSSKKKRFDLGSGLSSENFIAKVAKIVRKRLEIKSELLVSANSRVQKSVNMKDVTDLLRSKKIMQSINSNVSYTVSLQGVAHGSSKLVTHKIYVNNQMEMCLLEFTKTLVIALADICCGH